MALSTMSYDSEITLIDSNSKLCTTFLPKSAFKNKPVTSPGETVTSCVLPYIPDTMLYQPSDLYARIFADSIDINLTQISSQRGVHMEAVTVMTDSLKLHMGDAIYCGRKLGSGILGRIKVIHREWTIVEVKFWTKLKGEEITLEELMNNFALHHDITFPTRNLHISDAELGNELTYLISWL